MFLITLIKRPLPLSGPVGFFHTHLPPHSAIVLCTHLESVPELVAHNVVEQRINAGGEKVQDTGALIQDHVDPPIVRVDRVCGVDSH